jgi:PAS domain S-box-containing protein
MRIPGSASPKIRFVAAAAAFATLYYVAAELTSSLAGDVGSAVLWPASGVYLGVMLVAPRHLWPALAVGAGLGSFAAYSHAGSSAELSLAFAVPSAAEGLLGAALIERIVRGRFQLGGLHDVSALVVGCAVATALVALSAGAVAAQTFGVSFAESWLRWWSADALGALALAPLVIAVARGTRERLSNAEIRYAACVVVLVAVAVAAQPSGAAAMVGGALTLPVLLWAGWRWGPRTAALGGAGVALAAMNLASGSDLLGGGAVDSEIHVLQAFLAALLVSSLSFAAAVADWRREHVAAARSSKRLRAITDSAPDGYVTVDAEGTITGWSARARAMFGLDADDALGLPLESIAPGVGPITPTPEARELTLLARDSSGREFPAALTVRPGIDGDDGLWHVFVRDLTESERLGKELDRAAQELKRREQARDEARTELRGTARELDRATRRIDELTAQLGDRDAQLAERDAQLGDRDAQLAERDAQLGDLDEDLNELRRTLTEARIEAQAQSDRSAREADRLRAELSSTAADLSRARETGRALGERLDREQEAARAEHARLAEDAEAARAEHARLAAALEDARADRARLAADLAAAHAERTRLAEELEGARDERDLVAEHGSELIARHDERGVCLAASAGARGLLGYEPGELVGRPGAELIHPDDRARLLRARAGQAEATFRARLRRRDGEYVTAEVTFRPADGHAGRLGEVTTIARPIAERRADDDAGRVAETRFRSLFGTLPSASALIGQDGRIRRANPALARLTGYSADQLEGTGLGTLVDDKDAAVFSGRLRQVATGQVATLRMEHELAHASGRTVPVELRVTPLPAAGEGGDGRLLELVVHFQDRGEQGGQQGQSPVRAA